MKNKLYLAALLIFLSFSAVSLTSCSAGAQIGPVGAGGSIG